MIAVSVADRSSLEFSLAQQAIWASLPISLRASAPGDAELVAVDGRASGWVDTLAAAVRSGARGVLVVRPTGAAPSTALRTIAADADDRRVAVVVETTWAPNPTVAEFARAAAPQLSGAALVDCVARIPVGDPSTSADVLLDQLALLRAASVLLESVRFAAGTAQGYTVNGAAGAALVALAAVRSGSGGPQLSLTVYGASSQAHVSVSADGTAAPAQSWVLDGAGKSVQPSLYESAGRASWRRLRDAVTTGTTLTDLVALADDLDAVGALSVTL